MSRDENGENLPVVGYPTVLATDVRSHRIVHQLVLLHLRDSSSINMMKNMMTMMTMMMMGMMSMMSMMKKMMMILMMMI